MSYLWRSSCKSIVQGVPSSLASQTSSSFFPKEVFTKYGCRKLVVALVEKKERNGVSWAGEGEGPSSGEVR